jgi:hypothetical protein
VIQTATAESRVVSYLQQSSGDDSSFSPNLVELIPALLTTIESNDGSPQEILQAQVCLGWIHWVLNEPALAAARLPASFTDTVDSLASGGEAPTAWTEVCLVKGCYIKGLFVYPITYHDTGLTPKSNCAVYCFQHRRDTGDLCIVDSVAQRRQTDVDHHPAIPGMVRIPSRQGCSFDQ